MKKLVLPLLLFLPSFVSANMDYVCLIDAENSSEIEAKIRESGCARNNILELHHSTAKPDNQFLLSMSSRWCRFDRNRDIKDGVLSCVLYSNKPRTMLKVTSV